MTGQLRPVNGNPEELQRTGSGKRRRPLLALDPVMEGGRHRKRARAWDADDEPIAVALPGEVTIDLSQIKSAPAESDIDAYAIFRDASVLVAEGTHVEMSGGVLRGDLRTHPRSPARRPNPASALALRPDWSSLPVTRPWRECAGAVFNLGRGWRGS